MESKITSFSDSIEELLANGDRKMSANTVLTYISRVKWLKQALKIKTLDLEKIITNKDVCKVVEGSKISLATKKLTFVILVSLGKKLDIDEDLQKIYSEKMDHYKDMNTFERRENKVSGKNEKNWTSWEALVDVFDEMPEETFSQSQDKLIVGLYTQLEWTLRLDFANVRVHYSMKEERDYNWLYWNPEKSKKAKLFLSQYKTAERYGSVVIDIEGELYELLTRWFFDFNTDAEWLLVNYKDKSSPLSEVSLSKKIPLIFEKYTGKKVTNGLLRHIKESNNIYDNADKYNNMTLNQKYELHKKLLHGLPVALEYAQKISSKKTKE